MGVLKERVNEQCYTLVLFLGLSYIYGRHWLVVCALVLCLWLGFMYGRHWLVSYALVLFLELVGWLREVRDG